MLITKFVVLSRYHTVVFPLLTQSLGHPNGCLQFEDILTTLHERITDIDYDVARAAISALAVFEEVIYLSSIGLFWVQLALY